MSHLLRYKRVALFCAVLTVFQIFYFSSDFKRDSIDKSIVRDSLRKYLSQAIKKKKNSDYQDVYKDSNTHIKEDFLALREDLNLSAVGQMIFRYQPPPEPRSKTYKIVIWNQKPFLEARHIYSFTKKRRDPFGQCSVSNCELSNNNEDVPGADAVVISLKWLKGLKSLPNTVRSPLQRWIFFTDESPLNTFNGDINWTQYHGIFNWSMTYRLQSDVPVPYSRTIPLPVSFELSKDLEWEDRFDFLVPNADIKRRDVLVAVLISNCNTENDRLEYVHELKYYLEVDIYGGCGEELKNSCPRKGKGKNVMYEGRCPQIDKYLFYLAFENTNCHEYISEKPFWNAYKTGAVPVIMGPSFRDCQLLLPPNSYVHVENFSSPENLAKHLLYLNSTMPNYVNLHDWRQHFEARNEHGFFGAPSMHYCRLCEALNYNSEEHKVYNDLSYYLDPVLNCFSNY